MGKVKEIGMGNRQRPYATLEPAVQFMAGEDPQGFADLRIGINSWLAKLIGKKHIGQVVAIQYIGSEKTPAGPTPMRKFEVYTVPTGEWEETLQDHAPGLGEADAGTDEEPPF